MNGLWNKISRTVLNSFGFGSVCQLVSSLEHTQKIFEIFLQNIFRRDNFTPNSVIYKNNAIYLYIKYHFLRRLYDILLVINLYDKMFEDIYSH